uniref:Uncharacterized protein n=2 Tax=Oryza brachyantha TaxID=4533 RepID=J3MBS6_ORYBR
MALLRHVSKPMLTNSSGGGKKRTRPTNGAATYKAAAPAKAAIAGCFANPDTYTYSDDDDDGDGGDDMRWESMFQDLKPT